MFFTLVITMAVILREVTTQSSTAIISALAFTSALAWNGAIKQTIDAYWPFEKNSLPAHWFYAVIVVLIMVAVTAFYRWYDTPAVVDIGTTDSNVYKKVST